MAGALWACAEWMSKLGRKEADRIAGELIHPNDKSKIKDAGVDWIPDVDRKLVAPLFNFVCGCILICRTEYSYALYSRLMSRTPLLRL